MAGNNPPVFIGDITAVTDTVRFELGFEVHVQETYNGIVYDGLYKYVKASVALLQYFVYPVNASTNFATAGLTTTVASTLPLLVGIPQQTGGIPIENFGWVYIGIGRARVRVAASIAIDVPLYTTATVGELSSVVTKLVSSIKLTTANGGASADAPCLATGRLQVLV